MGKTLYYFVYVIHFLIILANDLCFFSLVLYFELTSDLSVRIIFSVLSCTIQGKGKKNTRYVLNYSLEWFDKKKCFVSLRKGGKPKSKHIIEITFHYKHFTND